MKRIILTVLVVVCLLGTFAFTIMGMCSCAQTQNTVEVIDLNQYDFVKIEVRTNKNLGFIFYSEFEDSALTLVFTEEQCQFCVNGKIKWSVSKSEVSFELYNYDG